jgi:hypothetical protein
MAGIERYAASETERRCRLIPERLSLRAGVACAIWARGFLEPDDRLNVVKKQNFRLRNTQHSEETKWIPPRFSSLYFSFCCSAAAAGTAVDVGTESG